MKRRCLSYRNLHPAQSALMPHYDKCVELCYNYHTMKRSEYIKRKEVAQILGISGQQVDNYRKKGLLHTVQYIKNGMFHYKKVEVLALRDGKK